MNQKNHSEEEIDLRMIFSGFRKSYHNFLISIYRGISYMIRLWYVILGLVLLGVLLGYLQKTSQAKEAHLIVQLNFDSAYTIYEEVEKLNAKLKENDEEFLQGIGLMKEDKKLINNIKIEPFLNISEVVVEKSEVPYANTIFLNRFFDHIKLNKELLTSDIFLPKYKKHKITVTSASSNQEVLDVVINFLNDNELSDNIKEISRKNAEIQIEANRKSIAAIDSIALAFGKTSKAQTPVSANYFNLNELNLDNIAAMFEYKTTLLEETKNLEIELLKFDDTVKLINKPTFYPIKKALSGNKLLVYPVLFFFLFLVFMQVRRLYLKAKSLSFEKK